VPDDRRFVLLVNPSAGGGRAKNLLPTVEEELATRGLEHRTVLTLNIEHGREEAMAAAEAGEVPVVMSGDGLIGQVGGALVDLGIDHATMGVIPGGRGNDFARVAGIPTDIREAVAVLEAGHTHDIDVGEVDGARFLCIASFGFDSEANRIANEAKFIRGNLVYAYAALRALVAWKPAQFELDLDGKAVTVRGFSVAVANSKAYGGGMFIAPDAELDDGLLDVVTGGYVSKLRFLVNLPKVFKGTHVDEPEVGVHRAKVVRISADRPFSVYADGDPLADLPATVTVLPRALRVIVAAPGN
jgi:YegS/Rv2252/BmrU family lipid kinase